MEGVPLGATLSIGLAHAGGGSGEFAVLWERADSALYRAKALGRNRVESAGDDVVRLAADASVDTEVALAAA